MIGVERKAVNVTPVAFQAPITTPAPRLVKVDRTRIARNGQSGTTRVKGQGSHRASVT